MLARDIEADYACQDDTKVECASRVQASQWINLDRQTHRKFAQ